MDNDRWPDGKVPEVDTRDLSSPGQFCFGVWQDQGATSLSGGLITLTCHGEFRRPGT